MKRIISLSSVLLLTAAVAQAQEKASPLDGAVIIKSQEAVVETPIVAMTNSLCWTSSPIKPDGDREKWRKLGVKPIRLGRDNVSSQHGQYAGEKDFAAEIYTAWDYNALYIGVATVDDLAPAPNRVEFAFVSADTPLKVGWHDVGNRYSPDDVHFIFQLRENDSASIYILRQQYRMDSGTLQLACGNETERRAQIEEGFNRSGNTGMMFSFTKNGFTDIVIPWRVLQHFDPVSQDLFKMNISVHDADDISPKRACLLAMSPGLIGVFSGVHFPAFRMAAPPAGTPAIVRSQVATGSYLAKPVLFETTVRTPKAFKGTVSILTTNGNAVASSPVESAANKAVKLSIKVDSEQLPPGRSAFTVRLTDASGVKVAESGVIAPTADSTIMIYRKADIEARIAKLKANMFSYSNLVEEVRAEGLNIVYPRAYLALLDMFIARCYTDLRVGDTARVLRNTEYLENIYKTAVEYAETVLDDPSKQKIVPVDDPADLVIKNGHYWIGDRPVFFWGPCLFWYLRKDAHYAWELGFNSVVPELDTRDFSPQTELERQAYMKALLDNKIKVNAAIRVPDLQLTGADVRSSKLLREHPELKNMDQNNFMSFLVQHPVVRKAVDEGQRASIAFWNRYPRASTYWLWNEPWYLNYSEMTRQDFIKEMKRKYGNNIKRLNERWKSNLASFEDIKLIQWPDPKNYAPWYDFQMFRDKLLADFFKYLHDNTRRYSPDMPTHVKFMAMSLMSFDLELLQQPYEIIGRDGNCSARDSIYNDFFRSIEPEKPIIDTEVHIWYRDDPTVNAVAWKLAMQGISDANWWCWHSNPRFSDSIANAQSMNALAMSGLDIRRLYADYIYPIANKPAPFATFFPPVCERRTDIKMVRMRFEVAQSQYMLGIKPFYVTQRTIIGKKALEGRKYLFAGESMWVEEPTYRAIEKWVQEGGTLITAKNGFNCNEYGDPRDTGKFIGLDSPDAQSFGEHAVIYPYGKGRVIRINAIELLADVVPDGGAGLRGGGAEENNRRCLIYAEVLNRLLETEKLYNEVRILPADEKASLSALTWCDWRSVKLKDGSYSLVVCPNQNELKIVTPRPIKSVENLVDCEMLFEAPSWWNFFADEPEKPCEFVLPPTGGFPKAYRVELED